MLNSWGVGELNCERAISGRGLGKYFGWGDVMHRIQVNGERLSWKVAENWRRKTYLPWLGRNGDTDGSEKHQNFKMKSTF